VRSPRRALIVAAAVLLAGVLAPGPAAAQPAPAAQTVVDVRVEGNKDLDADAVLFYVKTRPGQPYSAQVVRDDVQRLLDTARFDEVVAVRTPTDQGVVVTFRVKERPRLSGLRLVGNKALADKKLLPLLTFGSGDAAGLYQIISGARAIRSKYRSSGYFFARVTWDRKAFADRREVIYAITEGPKVTVRKIRFKNNRAFSDRQLGGKIESKARFWPFRPGTLDAEMIERDVVALREFYREEGYLNAQVASLPPVFSPDRAKAEIVFGIEEGPRFRIGKTIFRGATVFAPDQIRRAVKLTAGEGYKGLVLRRDREKVRKLYGEIGYVDARVAVQAEDTAETGVVNLVYTIVESDRCRVGRIDIRGNEATRENVIRRQVQFVPGQWYNTAAADDAALRLRETRLFDKADITPYGDEPGVRNALVEVVEAKTAQFLIGASVSSNAGLLGNIGFTQRNFDLFNWPRSWKQFTSGRAFKGAGQTLRVNAEPGIDFMRFRLSWYEPYLFDRPYGLGASAFAFTSGRETYDETRYGGIVSLGHRFKNRWYGEVAGRIEGVQVDDLDMPEAPRDVRDVAGTSTLAGVKGTLVRDKTDSRWLPSRGDRLSVSYEQMAGDFTFGRAVADYHIYHTLYMDAIDRKHILAGRAKGGAIFGASPVFERFYGGGLGSIRGFDYRGISPRQGPYREVVGGDFMVFVGSEYTFPLVGRTLRGVVFLDTGTVESDVDVTTYRASAGFGVRLHVPFFGPVPMTLDFGFPLNKDEDDDTQLVSFSFGWVF